MVGKILNILNEDGLKGVLNRIKNRIYQEYYLYEIDLNNIKLEEKLSLGVLNESLIDKLYLESKGEISDNKIFILKNKIKFNVKDYIVLEKKMIVGHYGLAFENQKENSYINNDLKINKGSTYLFDDYTLNKFRGKGYHKKSILDRLMISKKLGYKKSIVLIYTNNVFSKKSYEGVGFKKIRKLYEIKILRNKLISGVKYGNQHM